MNGTKNDTYIITNKGNYYKVEVWLDDVKKSADFEDLQKASEWIEDLKGEENDK